MGLLDVPLINQNPDYPNGCEAAAATMLLNYLGIDITLEDFINNYLPMSDVYEKDGIRYGPNQLFLTQEILLIPLVAGAHLNQS